MSSAIDASKPAAIAALTADVRSNFLAAKNEITALQDALAALPAGPAGPVGPTGPSGAGAAVGLIGKAGAQGFGVGVYPGALPGNFYLLPGNTDQAGSNYGNYVYEDGSVLCFIPRFYYRIGYASSPRYSVYGANAIDITGTDSYTTEAAANIAGYAMHRAFKDGATDKLGFFIDKYSASPTGTTSCKSIASGKPISLTTNASYTRSATQTGCTGISADAITLSRSRGAAFNAASAFMYSAVRLLALAHAQAAAGVIACAWWSSGGINFTKGCNNASLRDADDTSVLYVTAGDVGSASKPLTGSGLPFAKTTHNGQLCGICDINGGVAELAIGITTPGTSATDTTTAGHGDAYALKTSVALASITAGWNGTTDAWGDAAHLATLYDSMPAIFPWGASTATVKVGNGGNNVFSSAQSGIGWLRTACGIPDTTSGTSAAGTDQFGHDVINQNNVANLAAVTGGVWSLSADAGLCWQHFGTSRSTDNISIGFRAAAYGA